jgi:hypothetical protein
MKALLWHSCKRCTVTTWQSIIPIFPDRTMQGMSARRLRSIHRLLSVAIDRIGSHGYHRFLAQDNEALAVYE